MLQASRQPHRLHKGASVPRGEYCYMQSPLMKFMADDIDLKSAPFALVIGQKPGISGSEE